jgi:hypothetical protein
LTAHAPAVRPLPGLSRVDGHPPFTLAAHLLNAATKPFDAINFLGSYAAGHTVSPERMVVMLDHVIAKLHRRLDTEAESELARGMYYPTRWDPF